VHVWPRLVQTLSRQVPTGQVPHDTVPRHPSVMVPQFRPVESLMHSVAAVPGTQQVLFRRHEDEGQSAPTTHSTQVRVCVSQAGVGAAQSEFCVQVTHCFVAASHAGVGG
jgi:hypothetical protein